MKITINEFDHALAKFTSAYGITIAYWKDDIPVAEKMYDVEIEIDDYFAWGNNIFPSDEVNANFSIEGNHNVFHGKIMSYQENGILVIALGDDIILLEVDKAPDNNVVFIKFVVLQKNALLYPVNL